MSFDLASLNTTKLSDEGVSFELRNTITDGEVILDKEGKPLTITVLGKDGDKLAKIFRKYNNKKKVAGSYKKDSDFTEEEKEDFAYKMYAEATVAWSSNIEENGKPLSFSIENAVHLYKTYPWIFEQVIDFISDRESFLPSKKKETTKS